MKFMMFIKHPKDYDFSEVPPALFEAMGRILASGEGDVIL